MSGTGVVVGVADVAYAGDDVAGGVGVAAASASAPQPHPRPPFSGEEMLDVDAAGEFNVVSVTLEATSASSLSSSSLCLLSWFLSAYLDLKLCSQFSTVHGYGLASEWLL